MDATTFNNSFLLGQRLGQPFSDAIDSTTTERRKLEILKQLEAMKQANEIKTLLMKQQFLDNSPLNKARADYYQTEADKNRMGNDLAQRAYDESTAPTARAVPFSKSEQLDAVNTDRRGRGESAVSSLDDFSPEARKSMGLEIGPDDVQKSQIEANKARAFAALALGNKNLAAAFQAQGGGAQADSGSGLLPSGIPDPLSRAVDPIAKRQLQVKLATESKKRQADINDELTKNRNLISALDQFEKLSAAHPTGAVNRFMPNLLSSDLQTMQALQNQFVRDNLPKGFTSQLSDADRRFLEQAAPNMSKNKDANVALIGRWKAAAKTASDYAEFLDTFYSERGNHEGADMIWRAYMKSNPLFDAQGQPNPKRQDWQEFMTGKSWQDIQGGVGGNGLNKLSHPSENNGSQLPEGKIILQNGARFKIVNGKAVRQ
jgi:hypothetical protein